MEAQRRDHAGAGPPGPARASSQLHRATARHRRHHHRYRADARERRGAGIAAHRALRSLYGKTSGALALVSGRHCRRHRPAVRAVAAAGDRRPWRGNADRRRSSGAVAVRGDRRAECGAACGNRGSRPADHHRGQRLVARHALPVGAATGATGQAGSCLRSLERIGVAEARMLYGKSVFEHQAAEPSARGLAVRELMQQPPFARRQPGVHRRRHDRSSRYSRCCPNWAGSAIRSGGPWPARAGASSRPAMCAAGSRSCAGAANTIRHERFRLRSRGHRQWPHRGAALSRRRGSCGGASRVSTATRCSAGCWPATRKRDSPTSCSTGMRRVRHPIMCATPRWSRRFYRIAAGGAVRITDFAPRFREYDRTFRPPQLVRIIEPIAGLPRITIRFRPTSRYGVPIPSRSIGSNHISFRRRQRGDPPDHRRAACPTSIARHRSC